MSANESRRRGDPPSQQKDGKPITIPFRYQALEDNVYSTRFVQIETAESKDSLLVCSLTHVAFGDRPKFEALSYMWGGEDEQRAITLNGCQFHVRKNLFDALVYLRSRGQTGFLWVDALCIDQNNIKERTKQVRIMRHIYFRAASVVVWLGSKYSRYQKSLTEIQVSNIVNPTSKPEKEIPDAAGDREEETQTEASKVEREMVRQLVADEYWNRVWIIQEVGQNEMKRVCFGHMEVGWDDFIHLVTMHNAKGGPLRLAQQLSQKYAGAHTLRRLLIDHKDAQCKEPRDKIYGLVGLALDACGFPLDYDKSLLVVWNDTMEFMNRHGLFLADRETDIIYIGGLVKSLLMGAKCSPFQQIAQQVEPQTDLQTIEAGNCRETSNPKVFHINAYVLGCIRYIGPTTQEMAADLGKTDEWAEQLQHHYGSDLGDAQKESNQLIRAVLESSLSQLQQTCFNRVGLVKSKGDNSFLSEPLSTYWNDTERCVRYPNGTDDRSPAAQASPNTTLIGDVNLFQLYSSPDVIVSSKMGVVSSQARTNDLVCWLKGTKKAVVVRLQPRNGYSLPNLQVVGTALVAEDVAGSEIDHTSRCNSIATSKCASMYGSDGSNTTTLGMDARTVFVLLPESD